MQNEWPPHNEMANGIRLEKLEGLIKEALANTDAQGRYDARQNSVVLRIDTESEVKLVITEVIKEKSNLVLILNREF